MRFVVVSLRNAHGGADLIDLFDGYVLFLKKRLDAVDIVGSQGELGFGISKRGAGAGDRGLGGIDRGGGGFHAGAGAVHCRAGGFDGAALGGDVAFGVDDLLFQGFFIGKRLLQRVFVRAGIDGEKQIAFPGESIVFDGELDEAAVYFGGDFDKVGAHVGVIGARIPIGFLDDEHEHGDSAHEDAHSDEASDPFANVAFRHSLSYRV